VSWLASQGGRGDGGRGGVSRCEEAPAQSAGEAALGIVAGLKISQLRGEGKVSRLTSG
jgi:hypothetical protein